MCVWFYIDLFIDIFHASVIELMYLLLKWINTSDPLQNTCARTGVGRSKVIKVRTCVGGNGGVGLQLLLELGAQGAQLPQDGVQLYDAGLWGGMKNEK